MTQKKMFRERKDAVMQHDYRLRKNEQGRFRMVCIRCESLMSDGKPLCRKPKP